MGAFKEFLRNNFFSRLLKPKRYFSSVNDINLDELKRKGIRSIIVDLDDTLLPRREYKIPLSTYTWIQQAKEKGFKIFIASNGSRLLRIEHVARTLQVDGQGLAFKPLPFAFMKFLSKSGSDVKETAVIGDQLITDILGGNLLNMHTILIDPMSVETSVIRVPFRVMEDFLIRFFRIRKDS